MKAYNISCGLVLGVAMELITRVIQPKIEVFDRIMIVVAVGYAVFIGLTSICEAIKAKK